MTVLSAMQLKGEAGFQFSLSNAGEGKSNGGEYIVRVVNGGELF